MNKPAYRHLSASTADNGVLSLVLNRPEVLNAVNPELARELPDALAAAAADDSVRVVVITGAGRAFCAGLDLANPAGMKPASRGERHDPLAWVGRWVLAMAECEKPVIAAVNGVAAGAGFGLALAADVRLLSDTAHFSAGYIKRALTPDAGVSYFLPRLVGAGRAMELLMTGRDVRPEEAERIGLASAVYPAMVFSERVSAYAAELAAGPSVALALTKRLVRSSLDTALLPQLRDELTQIRTCVATADVKEAMAAFKEKREARFEGGPTGAGG